MAMHKTLPILLVFVCLSSAKADNSNTEMTWKTYQSLLQAKHKSQQNAIKTLYGMDNQEKLLSMIKVVYEGIFKVIGENQKILLDAAYVPGEFVPSDEKIREALSSVVENTIFFSEVMLRFPDSAHQLYDRNAGWKKMVKWCVSFIQEAGILEGIPLSKMIELVSQEINLVPKGPGYVNPFTKENMMKFMEHEKMMNTGASAKAKPKKKKLPKGPRLSRTEL